jgi:hypothetical protein
MFDKPAQFSALRVTMFFGENFMQLSKQAIPFKPLLIAITLGSLATGCTGSFNVVPSLSKLPLPIPTPALNIHDRGAIQFQPGATSTSVNHYLASGIDRYTLKASAGQSASFTISSPNQNVLLTLIDPDGNPFITSESGAFTWSGVLPKDGNYTVEAVDTGDPAQYNLAVSIQPSSSDTQPSSSNSQTRDQGEIQFQSGATSAVETRYLPEQGDIDRYTFQAYAGQSAQIDVSSSNHRVLFTITGPNQESLVEYQDGVTDWSGTLPDSGTYTIDVIADGNPTQYNLSLNIQSNS